MSAMWAQLEHISQDFVDFATGLCKLGCRLLVNVQPCAAAAGHGSYRSLRTTTGLSPVALHSVVICEPATFRVRVPLDVPPYNSPAGFILGLGNWMPGTRGTRCPESRDFSVGLGLGSGSGATKMGKLGLGFVITRYYLASCVTAVHSR